MEGHSAERLEMNPYCQAIIDCFVQKQGDLTPEKIDDTTCQFLSNMIQGMFIQFLVRKVSENYKITDEELEKHLLLVMTKILNDNFFVIFREKTHNDKEVVYQLAQRITEMVEMGDNRKPTDTICHWITQTYTGYQCTGLIMQWICNTPEFEKIIWLAQVHQRVSGVRETLQVS